MSGVNPTSAKPRLLPSGWWEGVPEPFRKQFERKILREGYLLNLDGQVDGLVFFRGAYQARILDGKDAFLCRYRHVPVSASALRGNCECSCDMSTAASRCAHQAALLFRVLSDAQGRLRQGGEPVGAGYAVSVWSQLALGVCRSHAGRELRLSLQPGRAVLADVSGLPVMEIPRVAGRSGTDEEALLPEGWEAEAKEGGFAAWARREIGAEDRALLKALAHAPAQRAEYGPAGLLGRAAYLQAPDPQGRLDWDEGGGDFRIRLHALRSDFTAWALLNVEQAYSLHRKFPMLVLGEGFPDEEPGWKKGIEVRVADGSRLRIRPFARAPDGTAGETRVFPPVEGESARFGDMICLPGVGFRRLLSGSGPLFRRYTGWKTYWVEPAAVPDFLRKHGEELSGADCDADPLLGNPRAAAIASLKVRSHGRDGARFRVGMEYRFGDSRLDLSRIKAHRDAGLSCLITSAGWVDFSAPEWAWMGLVKAEDWVQEGSDTLVLLDAPLLARICVLHAPQAIEVEAESGSGLDFLPSLAEGSRESLAGLVQDAELPTAGLRPYQVDGLRWMAHLASLGLSGILADDMGLGKTHQVMALMAWLRKRSAGQDQILVVCPTSVLYHWKERIDAFHPGLGVGVFHGSARDPERLDDAVCITSYGIVRNDQALFRARRYALLVLDEIQYSKNRDSETYQSLRDFPARSVIGLTGTPLENNVWEVKNLFDLILPGYFPGEAQFRREVAEPMEMAAREGGVRGPTGAALAMERTATDSARERFRRLVRPFLLRRTKAQVLPDLPEKVEEDLSCDMAPDQAELYRASLRQRGGPLLRELMGAGRASLLHVFQLLNHLKQVCNHPMTLAGAESPAREYGSGKWDLFTYLLEKSLEAGRKVVVFSQYLRMLERIESHLEQAGVGYATLTGATSNRPAVLKRFAQDPDCRVFCCSLKAGGVGIDLTAAETVIHYDRWWNAARENQATDRVHRLGQTRNVQVFKLITRGTIEERIDAIIRRKAAWMDALVPDDPEGGLKLFSKEELMELLRGAED
jgi:superfamily II DNA or RNA helicase